MRSLRTSVLVCGLVAGIAAQAPAQFSLSVGNPYTGQGFSIGSPGYGYSSGYSNVGGYGSGLGYSNYTQNYSTTSYLAGPGVIGGQYGYNSGYSGYSPQPGQYGYSSGYSGYTPQPIYAAQPVYRVGPNRPYYGAYGYGNYGSGSTDGYPPFRPTYRYRPFR